MNNKYIIKNCPCYQTGVNELNENCFHYGKCQDKSDCALKLIVDLCRHYEKHSDCGRDCPSFRMFLSKLLSKLDIQEVE